MPSYSSNRTDAPNARNTLDGDAHEGQHNPDVGDNDNTETSIAVAIINMAILSIVPTISVGTDSETRHCNHIEA